MNDQLIRLQRYLDNSFEYKEVAEWVDLRKYIQQNQQQFCHLYGQIQEEVKMMQMTRIALKKNEQIFNSEMARLKDKDVRAITQAIHKVTQNNQVMAADNQKMVEQLRRRLYYNEYEKLNKEVSCSIYGS